MKRAVLWILSLGFCLLGLKADAIESTKDTQMFDKIFQNWTDSFNRKDLKSSCALFSEQLVADYCGAPRKSYSSIRESFKKLFADDKKQYRYRYRLHNVYCSGNLAAVRITWYLTVSENGKELSTTEDQGLDVFERGKNGKWQIVNYIAYEEQRGSI